MKSATQQRSRTSTRAARRRPSFPIRLEALEQRLPPGDAWMGSALMSVLADAPPVDTGLVRPAASAEHATLAPAGARREEGISLVTPNTEPTTLGSTTPRPAAASLIVAAGFPWDSLRGQAARPAPTPTGASTPTPPAPTGGGFTASAVSVANPAPSRGPVGDGSVSEEAARMLDFAVQNRVGDQAGSAATAAAPRPNEIVPVLEQESAQPAVVTPAPAAAATADKVELAGPGQEPWFFQHMTQDMRDNHGMYDNAYTAMYEDWLAGRPYGGGGEEGGGIAGYGTDVRMSAAPFNGNQNEFQIDINPLDSRFAIGSSNSGRAAGVGIYRTSDGGLTWTPSDPPGVPSACCDPTIAYGSDGVAYLGILVAGSSQITLRSTDNGATWTRLPNVTLQDRNNVAVDPRDSNIVYVTYSELGGPNSQRIKGYRSTDGGQTWGANFFIGGERPANGYQQSSMPVVASNGRVYVGYQQYINSSQGCAAGVQNVVARSDDGINYTQTVMDIIQGGACTSAQAGRGIFCIGAGSSSFRSRSHPIMAVHPTNPDIVYMVYSGGDLESAYTCAGSTGRHGDTLFRKSTDGGATWSDPLRINTDPLGSDQYYPWIDVSQNGRIWVGWNDRRNDPSNFRSRWYQAYSTDEGATWTEDMVADGDTQPSTFIGDYHGLAAANDRVLGMWFDSRSFASGDPYTDPHFQFGLSVVNSDPARDAIVTTQTTQFVLDFNEDYEPASVDASDLTVNSIPADNVAQTDPNTLTFTFNTSPVTQEGQQDMAVAAGALRRASDGTDNLPFASRFRYDAIRLAVDATTPADGAVQLPFTTLSLHFNEPFDPATVGVNDLVVSQGRVTAAQVIDAQTVEYTLDGVTVEGAMTARLAAGAMTDAFGNPGLAYTGNFITDIGWTFLSAPAQSRTPGGSLVHDSSAVGIIGPPDDGDVFFAVLDPRQTVSMVITPTTPTGLQPGVRLFAFSETEFELVGVAEAAAANQAAVIQAVRTPDQIAGNPPAPLFYFAVVYGANQTTGGYRVQLTLNGDNESEAHNGASNDTLATAQDLTAAFQALYAGQAEPSRAAVLGRTDAGNANDYYSFTLAAGQNATLALTGLTNPNVNLDIVDAGDNVVAVGQRGAGNVTELVSNFTPIAGTYYARVRGAANGEYNLLITRNANFDTEGNNTFAAAQAIPTGRVLARVGGLAATGSVPSGSIPLPANINDGTGFLWDIQRNGSITNGTNDAYDGGLVHANFPATAVTGETEENRREVVIGPFTVGQVQVTRKVFVPSDQGYTRYLEIVTNPGASAVNYTMNINTNLGSDGGTIAVATSSGDLVFTRDDNWLITDDSDGAGDPTMLHVMAGPDARLRPTTLSRNADSVVYSYGLALEPGETKIIMHFASQNQNQATALAKAPQLEGLGLNALAGLTNEEQAAIVNFNLGDATDIYQVTANVGQVLSLGTTTPGDNYGDFDNQLDPLVRVYDANFNLVAQDDNSGADGRNAALNYTVPAGAGGTYYLEVVPSDQTAAPTSGDYVLEAQVLDGSRAGAPGAGTPTPLGLDGTALLAASLLESAEESVPVLVNESSVPALVAAPSADNVDQLFAAQEMGASPVPLLRTRLGRLIHDGAWGLA